MILLIPTLFSSSGYAEAQTPPLTVFQENVEEYGLTVTVEPNPPLVGIVHFKITPVNLSTNEPITDAIIRLVASSNDGEKKIQAVAINNPQAREVYASNLKFRLAQTWSVDLEIDSPPSGPTTATFPIEIGAPPSPPQNAGAAFMFLGIFAALVGGAAYLVWSSRRKLRNR